MTRTRLALVAAAALSAALGTTLATAPAVTAASSADQVLTGFRIAADGTAGGSWIGSRSTSGQVVYRVDPGSTRTVTTGFGTAQWRSQLAGAGPHPVTTRDTARAAWILAKYGTYAYDIQNAAVEVALDHLLYGGGWSLAGSRTAGRLAALPDRSAIRSFATTMLDDSLRYAGPYRVSVTAGSADVGGTIPVTVRVVATTSGAGIALLPVTVSSPSGTRALRTGSDGTATTTLAATTSGTVVVKAAVDKVPEDRLQVRGPTTTGASRIAVAGLKKVLIATTSAVVRAVPTLRVSTGSSQILAGTRTRPQLVITGLPAGYRGTATLRLYGPSAQRAQISCSGTPFATQALPVTVDGTYVGGEVRLDAAGFYGWSVVLPGSPTSASVSSGCAPAGAVVEVTQW